MSAINEYGLSSHEYAQLDSVWRKMLGRCYDERSARFYTYGARGITVCREWRESFHVFVEWAIAKGWKPYLQIERIDVNAPYCPENCTFITRDEQMRNKTNNIRISLDGEEKCLAEWCEIFQIPFQRTWARYRKYGYTDPKLLFYPGDLRSYRGCFE